MALNFSIPSPMTRSAGNTQPDVDENEKPNAALNKRRVTAEQRISLEKSFKVDCKLEPKRKSEIAEELGLQTRQVTVWFQNKRARRKTQELHEEYELLKLDYAALESNIEAMQRDNEKLTTEINCLKDKLEESEKARSNNVDLKIDSCPESQGLGISCNGKDNFIAEAGPVNPQFLPFWDWDWDWA